jgi:hypothetical protein
MGHLCHQRAKINIEDTTGTTKEDGRTTWPTGSWLAFIRLQATTKTHVNLIDLGSSSHETPSRRIMTLMDVVFTTSFQEHSEGRYTSMTTPLGRFTTLKGAGGHSNTG